MKQFWHIWKHLVTGCPWQCISGRDPKQSCCLECFLGQYSLQYNKVPRDWQNLCAIMRCRHIKVLFHIFSYYWGKQNCLLYLGLCYIEVVTWGFHCMSICDVNCLEIEKVNIKGKRWFSFQILYLWQRNQKIWTFQMQWLHVLQKML